MNRFMQHIPNFIDLNKKPEWIEFETTQDLLNLEIVKRHENSKKFYHFAMSNECLMKISDNGYYWWVIGYIEKPEEIDLPKWEGPKFRR